MNHWTKYLKEAGTITKEGESQMILFEKINDLQKQLDLLKESWKENESKIHKIALENWSWQEIDEAKAECFFKQRTEKEKTCREDLLKALFPENEIKPKEYL